MKKTGFTLVELLGIIVVLTVIAVISVVSINNLLNQTGEIEFKTYQKNLFNLTSAYIDKERETKFQNLDYAGGVVFVTLQELYDQEYLTEIPKNPKTNERNGQATIKARIDNLGQITYQYIDYNASISSYIQSGLAMHFDGATPPSGKDGIMYWNDASENKKNLTLNGFEEKDYLGDRYLLDGTDNFFSTYYPRSLTSVMTIQTSYVLRMSKTSFLWGFYKDDSFNDYRLGGGYLEHTIQLRNNALQTQQFASENYLNNYVNETIILNPTERKVSIYVNGKFYKEYPINITVDSQTLYFALGNWKGIYADGIICDFLVYNRALNQDEIKKNYEISKARFSL